MIVIDAHEGIRENSRRHGYLLSMLGIRQVIVLVNKMDLVGYGEGAFAAIAADYASFLEQVGLEPHRFVPVAAHTGDNIARRSGALAWYRGPTVLECLDELQAPLPLDDAPLRLPVQGVYKFTEANDTRRIIAGTVDTGTLRVGDTVVFYPSGKQTTVASIERFNRPRVEQVGAGEAAGFTMAEQVYVARGEIAARIDQPPSVAARLAVSLFWLGKTASDSRQTVSAEARHRTRRRANRVDHARAGRLEPAAGHGPGAQGAASGGRVHVGSRPANRLRHAGILRDNGSLRSG